MSFPLESGGFRSIVGSLALGDDVGARQTWDAAHAASAPRRRAPSSPVGPAVARHRIAELGDRRDRLVVEVQQQRVAAREHALRVERVQARAGGVDALGTAHARDVERVTCPRRCRVDAGPAGREPVNGRRRQPLGDEVEHMGAKRDALARPRQAQRQPIEPLRLRFERRRGTPRQRLLEIGELATQRTRRGSDQLGGRRRRRGAQVGGEIGKGDVGLVADAAHHRHRRGTDRAHHALVVEGPEVLERAAASTDHEHVDLVAFGGSRDRRAQRRGRIRALDDARIDHDAHVRGAPRQSRRDVVQGGAGERGDDADRARMTRQRPFQTGIEQPLGLEPRPQAQEALVQRARRRRLHRLGDELQLAARLVDREPAAQLDALAVGGAKSSSEAARRNIAQRSVAAPSGSFRVK